MVQSNALQMRARVVLLASATIMIAMAAHIAWWRIKRPVADIPAIFCVFLILPAPLYGLLALGGAFGVVPFSPAEAALAFVMHAALACAYVQTYPAVQAQSPTLSILLAVGAARDGLDGDGIVKALEAQGLVGERTDDLLRNGLLVREGNRIRPSRIGHLIAGGFGAYRRWLGLPRLGG
jgi:phosphatidylserine synthase